MKHTILIVTLLTLAQALCAQDLVWAKRIGGNGYDYAYNLHQDNNGMIFLAGGFSDSVDFDPNSSTAFLYAEGGRDAFFAKYDQDGNLIWHKQLAGIGNENCRSIHTAPDGTVIVTGEFADSTDFDPNPSSTTYISSEQTDDMFLAKYTPAGDLVWAKAMPGSLWDYGRSIQIDTIGNIYLGGYFYDSTDFEPGPIATVEYSNGFYDIFIAKYDPAGNLLWVNTFGGTNDDFLSEIAIDLQGNCFIAGSFRDTVDFDPSPASAILETPNGVDGGFLAKYDPNGNFLWVVEIDGPETDNVQDVETDAEGNVYISGFFQNQVDFDPSPQRVELQTQGITDGFVAKYSASGSLNWAKQFGGGSGEVLARTLTLDPAGNVYISGGYWDEADFDPSPTNLTLPANGALDFFIAKLNNQGGFIWANNIGGLNTEFTYDIKANTAQEVYLTGIFGGTTDFDPALGISNLTSQGNTDIFLAKYQSPIVFPIKLSSFEAYYHQPQDKVWLHWETQSEENSSHFIIERSQDATNFASIGHLPAKGNTNTTQHYQFPDPNYEQGANYYRLKSIDNDGSFAFSDIKQVEITLTQLLHIQIYPNPTSNKATIILPSFPESEVFLNLTTLKGESLHQAYLPPQTTSHNYSLDLSSYPTATYLLHISIDQTQFTHKIIKQ